MKMIQNVILSFALIVGAAGAQAAARLSPEEIVGNFIASIASDWHDIKVCEYISSHDNKKRFIERAIDPRLTAGAEHIASKETHLTNQESGVTLHLGVIVITYSLANMPSQALDSIAHEGYLKNTKILTRYLLRSPDSMVVIYYSETFMDEKINIYFNNLN